MLAGPLLGQIPTQGEVIRGKEESKLGQKRKQLVMDGLLTPPTKKNVESTFTDSSKSAPKELEAKIASFFYENAIPFNVAASSSFALMIDESINFAKQNPLQSYKIPHRLKLSWELRDKAYKSTQNLVSPVLAVA